MKTRPLPKSLLRLLCFASLAAACAGPPPPPAAPAPEFDSKAWTRASVTGREQLRKGELKAAQASFERALEESKKLRISDVRRQTSLSNLENVSEAYWEQGSSEGYARVGAVLVAEAEQVRGPQAPSLGDLYHRLGQTQSATGEWEKAEASLARAIEIKATANPTAPEIADLQVEMALTRLKLGNFEAVQVDTDKALEFFEANDSPAQKPMSALIVQSRAFRESGDLERADSALARARRLRGPESAELSAIDLSLETEDARLRAARGDLAGAQKDYVELIQRLDKTLPAAALTTLLWAELAELRISAGDPKSAEEAADSGLERMASLRIKRDPRARLLAARARAQRAQGMNDSALTTYEQAIEASRKGGPAGRALAPALEQELAVLRATPGS